MATSQDWYSWYQYLFLHERRLRDFEHFIREDTYRYEVLGAIVAWDGVVFCADGIEIHGTQTQERRYRDARPEVRTIEYSYHVLQRTGTVVTNLFRYDNIGNHGGADRHHSHRFYGGTETIQPSPRGGAGYWPTLGDVLEEVCQWWEQQRPISDA